jgi:hypothetical protein
MVNDEVVLKVENNAIFGVGIFKLVVKRLFQRKKYQRSSFRLSIFVNHLFASIHSPIFIKYNRYLVQIKYLFSKHISLGRPVANHFFFAAL